MNEHTRPEVEIARLFATERAARNVEKMVE